MTNAPYLLPKARSGYRMGHGEVIDHMFCDGLQSPFDGKLMGHFAEPPRRSTDSRARNRTHSRPSRCAARCARFRPATSPPRSRRSPSRGRKGETVVDGDETPFTCDIEKIPTLKPAFSKDGTVTAASSSSISDGAAAVVLMSEAAATARGLKPLARIVGYASHAQAPEWFTTAPGGAIQKLLARVGWKPGQVDLYEINEAFAVRHDGRDARRGSRSRTGQREWRCLRARASDRRHRRAHHGHPGACPAQASLKRGIASLCIGGGEATALAVETV